jgi:hypothetical protein
VNGLSNCIITFHLVDGTEISESYRQDAPEALWKEIVDEYSEISECMEIQPMNTYAHVLIPKTSILFVSIKVEP